MRSQLPTGTVTFLFTDVEGSTMLLHELGAEAYARELAEHRRVIRDACAREQGVEVDTQGDAFFFAFPSAPGALAAAGQMTEALSTGAIQVRVGLHTGTPHLTSDGYVGEDVHRAARIAAAGHGGQVLVSTSTASLVGTDALRDLGEHRFKDLAAPERVYQLGDDNFPALKSLYRTNLPVPATPFLGREQELAEVVKLLRTPSARLVTLTGPGGTGKTRLALQAAAEASEHYPDGVFWVPLAPLRDPSLVPTSVAQALEVREQPGASLSETLMAALADKRVLLLFDNTEHLLPEVASELAAILATSGPLLLVTGRERLQLQGEQVYPVPTLEERDAVELFLSRARALSPGFTGNGEVSELCSRLDYLPLALELAAARTVLFSPEQLIERLAQRLDLLKGARDADPRQQTLRATIEWSYDLLSPEEQRLFRSLSVFAGGCSYEAAEEVAGTDPDTLQSLLDKSLLRRRDSALGPRYWMLETIREFAAEQLDARGEAEELRQRHAEWGLQLAEQFEAGMEGPDAGTWLSRLEQEQNNLRAALVFLEESGRTGIQLELVGRIFEFWDHAGTHAEGRRWAEAALARSEEERSARRAGALRAAAVCAWPLGDLAEAKAYAEESLSIFRELGDAKHTAWALNISGAVSIELGDEAEAEQLFEQARIQAIEAGETRIATFATLNLGDHALRRRDLARATMLTEEALALCLELGLEKVRAWALHNLALCLFLSGRELEAVEAATESLTLTGAVFYRTLTVALLGSVAAHRGDPEAGTRLLGAAAAAQERLSLVLVGAEAELYHETVEELRTTLGQERYHAAFAEGQAMELEEAIEYALQALGHA